MQSIIKNEFTEHTKVIIKIIESSLKTIEMASNLCIDCLNKGNKILLFGNGGSAADAQHIAAELVGRYKTERKGLSAIALTTDTSVITSIANDYGYLQVFERQIEALANDGDVVIGISTGGSSPNIINAIKLANTLGCVSIGLSGKGGGEFNSICEVNIIVPSEDTPRIQEAHSLIGHTICHLIDHAFDQNESKD